MSERVCLDEAEVLATVEERGFDEQTHVITITRETWRDLLVRPAQGLRRVTSLALRERSGE